MSKRRVHFAENVTQRSKKSKSNVTKPPVAKSIGVASSKPGTVDLFDPLGVYAKQEAEIAVLENEITENGSPAYPNIRNLFNKLKPTAADLTRTYTEDELKEFCLRVKCKVRMNLFNPVEDYAQRLRRQGRLQNRSERYVNKILTKAIMRNKDTALYSQEEIDMHRQFQWRERRRQNNLNLGVWNTEREFAQNKKRKHQLSQLAINSPNSVISDDVSLIDDTIQSVHEAGELADNHNMSEGQGPIQTSMNSGGDDSFDPNLTLLHESNEVANNSIINDEERLMQMSPLSHEEANENESGHKQTNPSMANNHNAHDFENVENINNSDDYEEIEFLDMVESENVDGNETSSESQSNQKETKLKSEEPRFVSTQELADMLAYTPRTQEVVCDITISSQASQGLLQKVVELNTESMTIEEDSTSESEDKTHANENSMQQSEPLVYDYFNSQIPLTSTQSQHGSTQPD